MNTEIEATVLVDSSGGKWPKIEKNEKGLVTYMWWSDDEWYRREYNEEGKTTYEERSDGSWEKFKYGDKGEYLGCIHGRNTQVV